MPGGHGHSHNCGHEAQESDHIDVEEMGILYSLYQKIDMENLECLNEEADGSGKKVFKPYQERLDITKQVRSDADEELLFNIPFTGNVKLKGLIIAGADDSSHPKRVRLFKNRPHMTFDDVRAHADQEFELPRDCRAEIEQPMKVVAFSSVYHLSIHVQSNYGSDQTRIYYIGLRGEFTEAHNHGVTICTYEARPNISDHKADSLNPVNRTIQ